jgi:hypothetical protein
MSIACHPPKPFSGIDHVTGLPAPANKGRQRVKAVPLLSLQV